MSPLVFLFSCKFVGLELPSYYHCLPIFEKKTRARQNFLKLAFRPKFWYEINICKRKFF